MSRPSSQARKKMPVKPTKDASFIFDCFLFDDIWIFARFFLQMFQDLFTYLFWNCFCMFCPYSVFIFWGYFRYIFKFFWPIWFGFLNSHFFGRIFSIFLSQRAAISQCSDTRALMKFSFVDSFSIFFCVSPFSRVTLAASILAEKCRHWKKPISSVNPDDDKDFSYLWCKKAKKRLQLKLNMQKNDAIFCTNLTFLGSFYGILVLLTHRFTVKKMASFFGIFSSALLLCRGHIIMTLWLCQKGLFRNAIAWCRKVKGGDLTLPSHPDRTHLHKLDLPGRA